MDELICVYKARLSQTIFKILNRLNIYHTKSKWYSPVKLRGDYIWKMFSVVQFMNIYQQIQYIKYFWRIIHVNKIKAFNLNNKIMNNTKRLDKPCGTERPSQISVPTGCTMFTFITQCCYMLRPYIRTNFRETQVWLRCTAHVATVIADRQTENIYNII
jgi:hypothetical protein